MRRIINTLIILYTFAPINDTTYSFKIKTLNVLNTQAFQNLDTNFKDVGLWDSNGLNKIVDSYRFFEKNLLWVYFSIFTFLENLYGHNIFYVNRVSLNLLPSFYINNINSSYLLIIKVYKRTALNFKLYNFLYILSVSFFFKDLTILKNFLSLKIKQITFKKHKKILSMLRYAFKLISSFFITYKELKGFKIYISGKIGAGGSVKKKTWLYKNGTTQVSSKNARIKYDVFQLWTYSGSLGVKVNLVY